MQIKIFAQAPIKCIGYHIHVKEEWLYIVKQTVGSQFSADVDIQPISPTTDSAL